MSAPAEITGAAKHRSTHIRDLRRIRDRMRRAAQSLPRATSRAEAAHAAETLTWALTELGWTDPEHT